jgi:formylglycine-generating enzyme required for sulfatase activity
MTTQIRRFVLAAWLLAAFGAVPLAAQVPPPATPPRAERLLPAETNSVGIQLVRLPAGSFWMGGHEPATALCAAFAEYGRKPEEFADEYPQHRVEITRPFWLGAHEVTVGQFRQFTQQTGYRTQAERDGQGGWGYDPATGRCSGRHPQFTWANPGFPQTDQHPVLNVTWDDAVAFCQWLSEKEGRRYRLPTEAEWEYACRAGSHARYPHGDDPAGLRQTAHLRNLERAAAYADVQDQVHHLAPGESLTAPVGSKAPNPWGLYDMLGNVWEWTADWYGEDFYARSPLQDPRGPAEGSVRVRRGGAWNTFPLYARPAYRNWNSPNTRCINLGFRVARDD